MVRAGRKARGHERASNFLLSRPPQLLPRRRLARSLARSFLFPHTPLPLNSIWSQRRLNFPASHRPHSAFLTSRYSLEPAALGSSPAYPRSWQASSRVPVEPESAQALFPLCTYIINLSLESRYHRSATLLGLSRRWPSN